MASLHRAFGFRIALGAALLASACRYDSNADFDDPGVMSPDMGGSGNSGGSAAAAGEDPGGGAAAGGAEASPGGTSSAGDAGKSSAGTGGSGGSAGGMGGGPSAGGKAGGSAGKAGQGGMAGSANGGTAGATMNPDPITIETSDIDDTSVSACSPSLTFGEEPSINVDGESCVYEALIDFPRLELPAGALVSDATLTLTCTNAGGLITVSYADEPWKELMVRWSTRPEVGATLGTITCTEPGELTIDLTDAFGAWLSGDHPRNGIYLRTEDSDGTDFASSEAAKASTRPSLSVTYTLPIK
jgi:hypothetical protein